MSVVQRLSESLANQIAAGEVVERPAAAVKELVENALDAGARRIEVVLEDGGRRRLEVVDDGGGMLREDALLALERHTTSKLRTSEDLFDIRTFGFRGEAIPSIASVSRFRLTTRRPEDLAATRLSVEGGRVVSVEEVGAPAGTRVEVTDLFFNVPARLKFLKARQTELGHVLDWVSRLALANPGTGFSVTEDGRPHLKAEATGDLRERIAAVLGREMFGALYPVDLGHGDVRITGFCAGPQRANATAREIFTFVNRRFVRDRGLLHAVARAYDGVLPIGRSPAVVLFLEVPPDKVDVNVHPQKLEVRFAEGRTVYDATAKAVGAVLATSPWLRSSAPARTYRLASPPPPDLTNTPPAGEGRVGADSRERADTLLEPLFTPRQQRIADALDRWKTAAPPEDDGLLLARRPEYPPLAPTPAEVVAVAAPAAALRFVDLRYLGQVHRTYLVCESPEGLILLDQHAAHERVLYEQYRGRRAGEASKGQPLLVPMTLEFSPADARLVDGALEELHDLGFELEPFGGATFSLKAAPAELFGSDLGRTIRELAAELRTFGTSGSAQAMEEALLARMACHTAVRARDALSADEVRALLTQLDGTPFHAQCPHGRPVAVRFDVGALQEMFGRTYEGTSRAAANDRLTRG